MKRTLPGICLACVLLSLLASGCSTPQKNSKESLGVPGGPANNQSTAAVLNPVKESGTATTNHELTQSMLTAFDLLGGAQTINVAGTNFTEVQAKMLIVQESFKGRKLSEGFPMAVKKLGEKYPNTTLTILTSKQPSFQKITELIGKVDATQMENMDTTPPWKRNMAGKLDLVAWHNYGAYSFGVSKGMVVALRAKWLDIKP